MIDSKVPIDDIKAILQLAYGDKLSEAQIDIWIYYHNPGNSITLEQFMKAIDRSIYRSETIAFQRMCQVP